MDHSIKKEYLFHEKSTCFDTSNFQFDSPAASLFCCASDIGFTRDIGFASFEGESNITASAASNITHHAAAGRISLKRAASLV